MNQVLVEAATMQKVNANAQVRNGEHAAAREAYSRALGYLDNMSQRLDDEYQVEVRAQARVVLVALHLNVAACDLKLGEYASCVVSCGLALLRSPQHEKALYRR